MEQVPEDIEKGYIVQDFLDSSVGIKGIVDGVHDFRITLNNGIHVSTLLRIPKPGKLVANFALCGDMEVLHLDDTPARFVDMAKEIILFFSIFTAFCIWFDYPDFVVMAKSGWIEV